MVLSDSFSLQMQNIYSCIKMLLIPTYYKTHTNEHTRQCHDDDNDNNSNIVIQTVTVNE